MYRRLGLAYGSLFALAAILIVLGFAFGQVEIRHFFTVTGVRTMLIASGCFFPLVWITSVAVAITRRRVERPTVTLYRMLRMQRRWLLRGTIFIVVVVIFIRCFSGFKNAIPIINPFWADPWLVKLDQMTFFGFDPWRLSHAIFGPLGTVFFDRVYLLWFLMMFLTLGWFCFTRNLKLQIRGLMCYLLSWGLLGGATALWLSSVGPCFYEQFYGNKQFAPLMAELAKVDAEYNLASLRSMQFLIGSLGVDRIGSGISAMPSMHVTIAMLSFLATLSYARSTVLVWISGTFALLIFIGSVHLGWHYAWDGIFGILGVTLFWHATGKFVDWVEAREQGQVASAPPLSSLPASA